MTSFSTMPPYSMSASSMSSLVTTSMPMATTNSCRLLGACNRISNWLGIQNLCSAGRTGLASSHAYLVRTTVAGGTPTGFLAVRASDRDAVVGATGLDPLDTSSVGRTSNKLAWLVAAVIGAVVVLMFQVSPMVVASSPFCFSNRKSNDQK